MDKKNVVQFKSACGEYLSCMGIYALRAYGRLIRVATPAKLKKDELINEILGVLCGEIAPLKRVASAKNDYMILIRKDVEAIEALKERYLCGKSSETPEKTE